MVRDRFLYQERLKWVRSDMKIIYVPDKEVFYLICTVDIEGELCIS